MDTQKALKAALKAAQIGREILQDYFGKLRAVSEKNQMGLVSEADEASEVAISTFLQQEFPDFEILGEEASYKKHGSEMPRPPVDRTRWIIDPLDGTTNYVHQFPIYCISIGLEQQGKLVCGVID